MGSADFSGVRDKGVAPAYAANRQALPLPLAFVRTRLAALPTALRAGLIVSLVFACCFIAYDLVQSQRQAEARLALGANLLASHLAGMAAQDVQSVLDRHAEAFGNGVIATVRDVSGKLAASTDRATLEFEPGYWLTVRQDLASRTGAVVLAQPRVDILIGVAQRALVLGLVLGAVLIVAARLVKPQSAEAAPLAWLAALEQELHSARRRAEEHRIRGEAAARAQARFLAHLNHELRTPLNHIIGFADLIGHQNYGPVGDSRYLSYAKHIRQSGEVLLGALTRMLELAEFESGARIMKQEEVALTDLLGWAQRRFADQAERAGIGFVIEAPEALVLAGDAHCYRRMLGGIIENALRFTPAGGRIGVTAWTAQDGVVLEISDTGIGMQAEQLDLVNQAFLLGESALGGDQTGHGLGLGIARAIAALNGGDLRISSTPAIGTTVAISLPLAAPQPARARRAA